MTAPTYPKASAIIVCGDRRWKDQALVFQTLDTMNRQRRIDHLIHGGATGADSLAGRWMQGKGRIPTVHRAEWKRFAGGAGPIRNEKMLQALVDLQITDTVAVVAFHDDVNLGKGTRDMVTRAAWSVPVIWVSHNGVTLIDNTHPVVARQAGAR